MVSLLDFSSMKSTKDVPSHIGMIDVRRLGALSAEPSSRKAFTHITSIAFLNLSKLESSKPESSTSTRRPDPLANAGVFFSTNTGQMFLYFAQNRASESPLYGVAVINASHDTVSGEVERNYIHQNRIRKSLEMSSERLNSRYFISSCCCGGRDESSSLLPGEVIISHGSKGELLSLISISLEAIEERYAGVQYSLPAQHTFLTTAERHPNWPYTRDLSSIPSLNPLYDEITLPTSACDIKPFAFTRSKLCLLGRYLFYIHETGSPQLDTIALVWDILRVGSVFLSLHRYTFQLDEQSRILQDCGVDIGEEVCEERNKTQKKTPQVIKGVLGPPMQSFILHNVRKIIAVTDIGQDESLLAIVSPDRVDLLQKRRTWALGFDVVTHTRAVCMNAEDRRISQQDVARTKEGNSSRISRKVVASDAKHEERDERQAELVGKVRSTDCFSSGFETGAFEFGWEPIVLPSLCVSTPGMSSVSFPVGKPRGETTTLSYESLSRRSDFLRGTFFGSGLVDKPKQTAFSHGSSTESDSDVCVRFSAVRNNSLVEKNTIAFTLTGISGSVHFTSFSTLLTLSHVKKSHTLAVDLPSRHKRGLPITSCFLDPAHRTQLRLVTQGGEGGENAKTKVKLDFNLSQILSQISNISPHLSSSPRTISKSIAWITEYELHNEHILLLRSSLGDVFLVDLASIVSEALIHSKHATAKDARADVDISINIQSKMIVCFFSPIHRGFETSNPRGHLDDDLNVDANDIHVVALSLLQKLLPSVNHPSSFFGGLKMGPIVGLPSLQSVLTDAETETTTGVAQHSFLFMLRDTSFLLDCDEKVASGRTWESKSTSSSFFRAFRFPAVNQGNVDSKDANRKHPYLDPTTLSTVSFTQIPIVPFSPSSSSPLSAQTTTAENWEDYPTPLFSSLDIDALVFSDNEDGDKNVAYPETGASLGKLLAVSTSPSVVQVTWLANVSPAFPSPSTSTSTPSPFSFPLVSVAFKHSQPITRLLLDGIGSTLFILDVSNALFSIPLDTAFCAVLDSRRQTTAEESISSAIRASYREVGATFSNAESASNSSTMIALGPLPIEQFAQTLQRYPAYAQIDLHRATHSPTLVLLVNTAELDNGASQLSTEYGDGVFIDVYTFPGSLSTSFIRSLVHKQAQADLEKVPSSTQQSDTLTSLRLALFDSMIPKHPPGEEKPGSDKSKPLLYSGLSHLLPFAPRRVHLHHRYSLPLPLRANTTESLFSHFSVRWGIAGVDRVSLRSSQRVVHHILLTLITSFTDLLSSTQRVVARLEIHPVWHTSLTRSISLLSQPWLGSILLPSLVSTLFALESLTTRHVNPSSARAMAANISSEAAAVATMTVATAASISQSPTTLSSGEKGGELMTLAEFLDWTPLNSKISTELPIAPAPCFSLTDLFEGFLPWNHVGKFDTSSTSSLLPLLQHLYVQEYEKAVVFASKSMVKSSSRTVSTTSLQPAQVVVHEKHLQSAVNVLRTALYTLNRLLTAHALFVGKWQLATSLLSHSSYMYTSISMAERRSDCSPPLALLGHSTALSTLVQHFPMLSTSLGLIFAPFESTPIGISTSQLQQEVRESKILLSILQCCLSLTPSTLIEAVGGTLRASERKKDLSSPTVSATNSCPSLVRLRARFNALKAQASLEQRVVQENEEKPIMVSPLSSPGPATLLLHQARKVVLAVVSLHFTLFAPFANVVSSSLISPSTCTLSYFSMNRGQMEARPSRGSTPYADYTRWEGEVYDKAVFKTLVRTKSSPWISTWWAEFLRNGKTVLSVAKGTKGAKPTDSGSLVNSITGMQGFVPLSILPPRSSTSTERGENREEQASLPSQSPFLVFNISSYFFPLSLSSEKEHGKEHGKEYGKNMEAANLSRKPLSDTAISNHSPLHFLHAVYALFELSYFGSLEEDVAAALIIAKADLLTKQKRQDTNTKRDTSDPVSLLPPTQSQLDAYIVSTPSLAEKCLEVVDITGQWFFALPGIISFFRSYDRMNSSSLSSSVSTYARFRTRVLEKRYGDYLVSTLQFHRAGLLFEQKHEYKAAIKLYIRSDCFSAATRLATRLISLLRASHKVKNAKVPPHIGGVELSEERTVLYHELIDSVLAWLRRKSRSIEASTILAAQGEFLQACEELRSVGRYSEALEMSTLADKVAREAPTDAKAQEIASVLRTQIPHIHHDWADTLVKEGKFEEAGDHFVEAGALREACICALRASQWNLLYSVLDRMDPVETKELHKTAATQIALFSATSLGISQGKTGQTTNIVPSTLPFVISPLISFESLTFSTVNFLREAFRTMKQNQCQLIFAKSANVDRSPTELEAVSNLRLPVDVSRLSTHVQHLFLRSGFPTYSASFALGLCQFGQAMEIMRAFKTANEIQKELVLRANAMFPWPLSKFDATALDELRESMLISASPLLSPTLRQRLESRIKRGRREKEAKTDCSTDRNWDDGRKGQDEWKGREEKEKAGSDAEMNVSDDEEQDGETIRNPLLTWSSNSSSNLSLFGPEAYLNLLGLLSPSSTALQSLEESILPRPSDGAAHNIRVKPMKHSSTFDLNPISLGPYLFGPAVRRLAFPIASSTSDPLSQLPHPSQSTTPFLMNTTFSSLSPSALTPGVFTIPDSAMLSETAVLSLGDPWFAIEILQRHALWFIHAFAASHMALKIQQSLGIASGSGSLFFRGGSKNRLTFQNFKNQDSVQSPYTEFPHALHLLFSAPANPLGSSTSLSSLTSASTPTFSRSTTAANSTSSLVPASLEQFAMQSQTQQYRVIAAEFIRQCLSLAEAVLSSKTSSSSSFFRSSTSVSPTSDVILWAARCFCALDQPHLAEPLFLRGGTVAEALGGHLHCSQQDQALRLAKTYNEAYLRGEVKLDLSNLSRNAGVSSNVNENEEYISSRFIFSTATYDVFAREVEEVRKQAKISNRERDLARDVFYDQQNSFMQEFYGSFDLVHLTAVAALQHLLLSQGVRPDLTQTDINESNVNVNANPNPIANARHAYARAQVKPVVETFLEQHGLRSPSRAIPILLQFSLYDEALGICAGLTERQNVFALRARQRKFDKEYSDAERDFLAAGTPESIAECVAMYVGLRDFQAAFRIAEAFEIPQDGRQGKERKERLAEMVLRAQADYEAERGKYAEAEKIYVSLNLFDLAMEMYFDAGLDHEAERVRNRYNLTLSQARKRKISQKLQSENGTKGPTAAGEGRSKLLQQFSRPVGKSKRGNPFSLLEDELTAKGADDSTGDSGISAELSLYRNLTSTFRLQERTGHWILRQAREKEVEGDFLTALALYHALQPAHIVRPLEPIENIPDPQLAVSTLQDVPTRAHLCALLAYTVVLTKNMQHRERARVNAKIVALKLQALLTPSDSKSVVTLATDILTQFGLIDEAIEVFTDLEMLPLALKYARKFGTRTHQNAVARLLQAEKEGLSQGNTLRGEFPPEQDENLDTSETGEFMDTEAVQKLVRQGAWKDVLKVAEERSKKGDTSALGQYSVNYASWLLNASRPKSALCVVYQHPIALTPPNTALLIRLVHEILQTSPTMQEIRHADVRFFSLAFLDSSAGRRSVDIFRRGSTSHDSSSSLLSSAEDSINSILALLLADLVLSRSLHELQLPSAVSLWEQEANISSSSILRSLMDEIETLQIVSRQVFWKAKLGNMVHLLTTSNASTESLGDLTEIDRRLVHELYAASSLSILRFASLLPADRIFFEAGKACSEASRYFIGSERRGYLNSAIVLLSRFCDLYESSSDPSFGNIDNEAFRESDIPAPFSIPIPKAITVSAVEAEEARAWITKTLFSFRSGQLGTTGNSTISGESYYLGVTDAAAEKSGNGAASQKQVSAIRFPTRSCLRCKRDITWFSLRCVYCKHVSDASHISGVPMDLQLGVVSSQNKMNKAMVKTPLSKCSNALHGTPCGGMGFKREWNCFVKLFQACPKCHNDIQSTATKPTARLLNMLNSTTPL